MISTIGATVRNQARRFVQFRNYAWDARALSYKNNDAAAVLVSMNENSVNSISPQYFQNFHQTLDQIESEKDYKHLPLFLESSNEKTFSAGLNLQFITTELTDEAKVREFANDLNEMFRRLFLLDRPTVALLNGNAIAGGWITALCCDFRLAVHREDKKQPIYSLREMYLGLPLPGVVTGIVSSQIPTNALYQSVLTGQTLTPKEAYDAGIITKLVENKESLQSAAFSLINDRIDMNISGEAYAVMKRALKQHHVNKSNESTALDDAFVTMLNSDKVKDKIKQVLQSTKK
ncbi:delta3-delta2-enoyl-CoA isomerase [Acrasis kona]|uniref:Delta3-delta2-enoyl-CoA isomerase n=1 Tax=Acrasis kona TaxID=1008807 RepID=A0AAW2YRH3_9EUKA